MDQGKKLPDFIPDFYDAAVDPSLWVDVLEKVAQFIGGPSAFLFWKDATNKNGNLLHAFGLDPHDARLSFETYLKLDPVIAAGAFAEIDEPVSVEDVISYDEYLRTPFHREWAEPQGLVDFSAAWSRSQRPAQPTSVCLAMSAMASSAGKRGSVCG